MQLLYHSSMKASVDRAALYPIISAWLWSVVAAALIHQAVNFMHINWTQIVR